MLSYQRDNSHHKDKSVSRLSYLYNVNPHTWKDLLYIEMGPCESPYMERPSLYWDVSMWIPIHGKTFFILRWVHVNPHTWKDLLYIEMGPSESPYMERPSLYWDGSMWIPIHGKTIFILRWVHVNPHTWKDHLYIEMGPCESPYMERPSLYWDGSQVSVLHMTGCCLAVVHNCVTFLTQCFVCTTEEGYESQPALMKLNTRGLKGINLLGTKRN